MGCSHTRRRIRVWIPVQRDSLRDGLWLQLSEKIFTLHTNGDRSQSLNTVPIFWTVSGPQTGIRVRLICESAITINTSCYIMSTQQYLMV